MPINTKHQMGEEREEGIVNLYENKADMETTYENAPPIDPKKYPTIDQLLLTAMSYALKVGQANPNTPHGVDMLSFRKDFEKELDIIISSQIEAAKREEGGLWQTAIGYNCEPEEIERIHAAVKALLSK